jgi:hypothetical protein
MMYSRIQCVYKAELILQRTFEWERERLRLQLCMGKSAALKSGYEKQRDVKA